MIVPSISAYVASCRISFHFDKAFRKTSWFHFSTGFDWTTASLLWPQSPSTRSFSPTKSTTENPTWYRFQIKPSTLRLVQRVICYFGHEKLRFRQILLLQIRHRRFCCFPGRRWRRRSKRLSDRPQLYKKIECGFESDTSNAVEQQLRHSFIHPFIIRSDHNMHFSPCPWPQPRQCSCLTIATSYWRFFHMSSWFPQHTAAAFAVHSLGLLWPLSHSQVDDAHSYWDKFGFMKLDQITKSSSIVIMSRRRYMYFETNIFG